MSTFPTTVKWQAQQQPWPFPVMIREQRFFHQEFGSLCASCSFIRTVSSLLLPAHITYCGLRGKRDSINRKISSYGFKTHRHHQMWRENGTIYLVTSLRAVSNEQSTLKTCFFLLAKRTGFYFFMIVSKKPMLSEYGTLCTGESNWPVFTSHMTIPYTTAVFPKGKEVFECKFYSVLSPPKSWLLVPLLGWRSDSQSSQLPFKEIITE